MKQITLLIPLFFFYLQAATASRELSEENLVRFTNDINKRFFEWTHGNDNNEKLGAIIGIGE
jgi:FKBP12-rapamycin complex-associated protein